VSFSVSVVDTCPSTIISQTAPAAMTNGVTLPAVTQTVPVPTDSLSTSTALPNVCGTFTYSLSGSYPFISVDPTTGLISLISTNMMEISSYTITLVTSLTSYPSVTTSTTFSVTLTDPCVSTLIYLPTLSAFTITAFDGIGFDQTFLQWTDTAGTSAGNP